MDSTLCSNKVSLVNRGTEIYFKNFSDLWNIAQLPLQNVLAHPVHCEKQHIFMTLSFLQL